MQHARAVPAKTLNLIRCPNQGLYTLQAAEITLTCDRGRRHQPHCQHKSSYPNVACAVISGNGLTLMSSVQVASRVTCYSCPSPGMHIYKGCSNSTPSCSATESDVPSLLSIVYWHNETETGDYYILLGLYWGYTGVISSVRLYRILHR